MYLVYNTKIVVNQPYLARALGSERGGGGHNRPVNAGDVKGFPFFKVVPGRGL